MEPIWKQKLSLSDVVSPAVAELAQTNREVHQAKVAYEAAVKNFAFEVLHVAMVQWRKARNSAGMTEFIREQQETSALSTEDRESRSLRLKARYDAAAEAWELDNPAPDIST